MEIMAFMMFLDTFNQVDLLHIHKYISSLFKLDARVVAWTCQFS